MHNDSEKANSATKLRWKSRSKSGTGSSLTFCLIYAIILRNVRIYGYNRRRCRRQQNTQEHIVKNIARIVAILTLVVFANAACSNGHAQQQPTDQITKPFPLKGVKLEGKEGAEFAQDALLGAFLQMGAVMSSDGVMITGQYGEDKWSSDVSPTRVRINARGIQPNGATVAGTAEVNEKTARMEAGLAMYVPTDMTRLAAKEIAEQFKAQLLAQQKFEKPAPKPAEEVGK